jgi:hypothetical protein
MLGRYLETAVALQCAMLMTANFLMNPGHELLSSPALLLCGCHRCSSATQAAALQAHQPTGPTRAWADRKKHSKVMRCSRRKHASATATSLLRNQATGLQGLGLIGGAQQMSMPGVTNTDFATTNSTPGGGGVAACAVGDASVPRRCLY